STGVPRRRTSSQRRRISSVNTLCRYLSVKTTCVCRLVDHATTPPDMGVGFPSRGQEPMGSVFDCETGGAGEAPADAGAGGGDGSHPACRQPGGEPGREDRL